jgi:hypothetical protein
MIHLQKWQKLLPDDAPPLSFFQLFLIQKSPQKKAQRAVAALRWVGAVVVARALAVVDMVVVVVAAMTVAVRMAAVAAALVGSSGSDCEGHGSGGG